MIKLGFDGVQYSINPGGSIYTTIMELDPKNHNGDGLLGPNSIMVVYIHPLGMILQGALGNSIGVFQASIARVWVLSCSLRSSMQLED